jgi:serine/threonine-protein phosphatase PGAM5
MATRTLYLIRHGNHENAHGPMRDGLTHAGVAQAMFTARRCRSLPVTAIYSSSMRRAAETAGIIARGLPGVPLRRTRLLWECIPHVPRNVAHLAASYVSADKVARHREQAERAFDTFFKRARGVDKHEILVCHGVIIRYFVCRVLRLDPQDWINMDMSNCGLSCVLILPTGRMALITHNDVGHLPPHLRTSLIRR